MTSKDQEEQGPHQRKGQDKRNRATFLGAMRRGQRARSSRERQCQRGVNGGRSYASEESGCGCSSGRKTKKNLSKEKWRITRDEQKVWGRARDARRGGGGWSEMGKKEVTKGGKGDSSFSGGSAEETIANAKARLGDLVPVVAGARRTKIARPGSGCETVGLKAVIGAQSTQKSRSEDEPGRGQGKELSNLGSSCHRDHGSNGQTNSADREGTPTATLADQKKRIGLQDALEKAESVGKFMDRGGRRTHFHWNTCSLWGGPPCSERSA